MVTCKHCSTPNSLDSTFCKRCGTALPEEDVQVAQERLTALIADGNKAFNEGRTDEAMAIAESACLSNPSSTAALSLKALCHERQGDLALALECADMIVDLNPDSELDKIKRNQLRTKLSVAAQLATQPPDRRSALVGSIAAVVLVICLGIGAAKYSNRPDKTTSLGPVVRNDVPVTNPQQLAGQTNGTPTQPQSGGQSQPVQQPTNPPQYYGPSGPTPVRPNLPYTDDGSGLPEPGGGTGETRLVGNIPIHPAVPNGEKTGSDTGVIKTPTPSVASERASTSDDPAPKPEDPHGTAAQNSDPGQIEIKISGGTHKSFGGSTDSGATGGALALDKIGIQRFQLGNYSSAASSFEQALRQGGDQVSLNQWLGRCYGNMGKQPEEIDAYKRCVAACQTALTSGTGNKDRIKAVLDTSQQKLKILQGN